MLRIGTFPCQLYYYVTPTSDAYKKSAWRHLIHVDNNRALDPTGRLLSYAIKLECVESLPKINCENRGGFFGKIVSLSKPASWTYFFSTFCLTSPFQYKWLPIQKRAMELFANVDESMIAINTTNWLYTLILHSALVGPPQQQPQITFVTKSPSYIKLPNFALNLQRATTWLRVGSWTDDDDLPSEICKAITWSLYLVL